MALIRCPECGHEVSEYAQACPRCGWPVDVAKAVPAVQTTVQAVPETSKAEVREEEQEKTLPARFGFPLAAAVLYTIYIIFEIVFVNSNGLNDPSVFDNSITAAFLGGAGSAMYIGMAAAAALWAGIGANRSGIVCTAMILMSIAAVLWLMHALFVVLPLVLGWIGYAKMRRAERARR